MAEGFWQADQAEMLAGYVPLYFIALRDLVARGDGATARVLVQHGFPLPVVTPETLHAGEDCLASAGLPASLGRLLCDQLDDLRRSLRVRSGLSAGRGETSCPLVTEYGSSGQNPCPEGVATHDLMATPCPGQWRYLSGNRW